MNRALTIFVVVLGFQQSATAQHEHGPGNQHGKPGPYVPPATYRQAVEEIDGRMHAIAELMRTGALANVHAEAEVIQKVGPLVGQLALKEGSGVPKEAVKDVNLAGKELAGKFEAIDNAGDSGDATGTKRVYDEMLPLLTTLRTYAPILYQCPMKCEGDKTYTKPGKCAHCGMALVDVRAHRDHEARHGGVFFMASDNYHHLEGTLSAEREFRIYFYDDFTRPLSAEKFSAEGKAWPKGGGEEQRKVFPIAPSENREYLSGRIDAAIKFPVSIKVHVDFKKGEKPQVFDFDFDQPSETPKETDRATRG